MRKSLLSLIILTFMSITVFAQYKTVVEVTDQPNEALRSSMSKSASDLISTLNESFVSGTVPNLTNLNMSDYAKQNVLQIWENSAFRCVESEIYQRCLTTSKGYQIRNLPFIVKESSESKDVVINYTSTGVIDAFYFAIENHKYQDIIRANKSITDLRRRQMILDFIENFRTAYNRKDIDLIETMYSDDALIITGNVCKSSGDQITGLSSDQVVYVKQNKVEYLTKLRRVFANNKFVNIGFDDIYVMQHRSSELDGIYGVTLRQAWRTSNYSDDGWLFLAIEFLSETEMQIHVRTWQPFMVNGKELPRNEVFQLGQFEF